MAIYKNQAQLPVPKIKAPLMPDGPVEMAAFYMKCRVYHGRSHSSKIEGWFKRESWESDEQEQPSNSPPIIGVRLEGQRPDETYEQAKKRMNKELKTFDRLAIAAITAGGICLIFSVVIKVFQ